LQGQSPLYKKEETNGKGLHSSDKQGLKVSKLTIQKEHSGSDRSPATHSDHSVTYLPNLPNITLRHTAFCK